jgi:hypothetical protein
VPCSCDNRPCLVIRPAADEDYGNLAAASQLWMPQQSLVQPPDSMVYPNTQATAGAPAAASAGYDDHKPRTPPPDLPSLLLDSRITYLGMPLVPAVTELIVAELLYLQVCPSPRVPCGCLWASLSICLSVCLFVHLSVCLSVHPSVCPSVRLSVCLSVYLSGDSVI